MTNYTNQLSPAERMLKEKWRVVKTNNYIGIYAGSDLKVAFDLANMVIAQYIVDEHNKALESPGYLRVSDHARLVRATQEAAKLQRENEKLDATLRESKNYQDMPYWRRIAMQRRELRVLNSMVNMYRRLWQDELGKNRDGNK